MLLLGYCWPLVVWWC